MEKFYIVTEKSGLRKEYLDYIENSSLVNEHVNEFMTKNNIEAEGYYASEERFKIVPTEKDLENFNKQLMKEDDSSLRGFKKNSKINKLWVKSLEEKKLKVLRKPYIGFYFRGFGRMSSRIFLHKDIVYCSFECEYGFNTPEGFEEIKASEFYSIIEEMNECK